MRYLNFATERNGSTGRQNDSRISLVERLVIVIDASPSMEDTDWPPSRLEAAKEAAVALIARKLRISPEDEVAVVSYAARAKTHCHPVTVGAENAALYKAIGRIRTRMWTNITAALRESGKFVGTGSTGSVIGRFLRGQPKTTYRGRIVLLTDGFHNHGDYPESVATRLKEAGVCIDCVGIGGNPDCVDESRLREIASLQPDGVTPRYTFIGDKSDLIAKFEQLAGRITR